MAKQTEKTESNPEQKRELPKGARSFANHGDGLTTFVEGEEIRGRFLGMREKQITDKRTREKKNIRVYSIQLQNGSVAKIGSRALLDGAFDDTVDGVGGLEKLIGQEVSFIRGEDKKTSGGDPMGTYEIIVY